MTLSSITVNRNDDYKDYERGIIHFRSLLDTFDEVNYVDWNSPSGSFLWEIQDYIPKTGRLKHYIITPEIVNQLIPYKDAQLCNETLSRNIALSRSETDWMVSTNIDIIAPKKKDLTLEKLDKNTFYTLSRREAPINIVNKFGIDKWSELRELLSNTISERYFMAKVTPNDNYSIINCCGDFQLAYKDVWNKIRGFEESMIYACFADTNIQKKAVLEGLDLKVLFEPPIFHIEHGSYYTKEDGSRSSDQGSYKGDNKAYNDVWNYVEFFNTTTNTENWGLKNINIEYEII